MLEATHAEISPPFPNCVLSRVRHRLPAFDRALGAKLFLLGRCRVENRLTFASSHLGRRPHHHVDPADNRDMAISAQYGSAQYSSTGRWRQNPRERAPSLVRHRLLASAHHDRLRTLRAGHVIRRIGNYSLAAHAVHRSRTLDLNNHNCTGDLSHPLGRSTMSKKNML